MLAAWLQKCLKRSERIQDGPNTQCARLLVAKALSAFYVLFERSFVQHIEQWIARETERERERERESETGSQRRKRAKAVCERLMSAIHNGNTA